MIPPGSEFFVYREDSVIVNFEDKKYEIHYFTSIKGSDLLNEITRTLLHGEDETLYELTLFSGTPFNLAWTIPFEGLPTSLELVLTKSIYSLVV